MFQLTPLERKMFISLIKYALSDDRANGEGMGLGYYGAARQEAERLGLNLTHDQLVDLADEAKVETQKPPVRISKPRQQVQIEFADQSKDFSAKFYGTRTEALDHFENFVVGSERPIRIRFADNSSFDLR